MFKKCTQPLRVLALLSSALVFTLNVAQASYYWMLIEAIGYTESKTIKPGKGGSFFLIKDGKHKVKVTSPTGSLDSYMAEQGVDQVTITSHLLKEEWVDLGDGDGYYRLTFTFGPSGAHFTPDELELELTGRYATDDTTVELLDSSREALESTRTGNADKVIYFIPHFSSYSYDQYY